jgi:hypothetical protein
MARVLTMIETSCPNALSKKVSTDEVLVNFDALTPRCFHEVNAFVLVCFLNLTSGKKNKKRKSEAAGSGGASSGAAEGGAASTAGNGAAPEGNDSAAKGGNDNGGEEEAEF